MSSLSLKRNLKRSGNVFDRRFRIMLGAHVIWFSVVCLLGAWWGRLLLNQAARIAELETQLGVARDLAQGHWSRTQRMLYWESGFFFGLMVVCSLLLFWLYWRDGKRAQGLQAFFASVTHELRTPLTSIRLQAESIADTLSIPNSIQKNVKRLLEDTIRLEAQVERTLELARIEGGGPVFNQSLQVKPWLERFLKGWESDYRGRVKVQASIDDLLINADQAAIQVVFKNLLENAVKHSKRDQVSISISTVPSTSSQSVCVVLKDDGQGYQGDQKTLGKLFQRGAGSQGTGVGLYLVKVLMAKMGGCADFAYDSGFAVTLSFKEGRTSTEQTERRVRG